MPARIIKLLLALCFALPANSAWSDENPWQHPDTRPWSLVAHSDLIVVGTLLEYTPDAQHNSGFVDIDVSRVLKGSISIGPIHTEYGVSVDLVPFLKANKGKPIIAFLMGGPDPYLHRISYQLWEGDGAETLMLDSASAEAFVSSEVEREKFEVITIPEILSKQDGDTRNRVDDAVDKLSSYFKWRRNQGIEELLTLGCKGVPYIVPHLFDQRPVHGMMQLFEGENDWIWTTDNFEKWGPRSVGEALPKVLFQITGLAWQLRDSPRLDQEPKQKQYDFWLVYLAKHAYQRDPEDYNVWHDDCVGQVW